MRAEIEKFTVAYDCSICESVETNSKGSFNDFYCTLKKKTKN